VLRLEASTDRPQLFCFKQGRRIIIKIRTFRIEDAGLGCIAKKSRHVAFWIKSRHGGSFSHVRSTPAGSKRTCGRAAGATAKCRTRHGGASLPCVLQIQKGGNGRHAYLPSFQISAVSFQVFPTFSHTTTHFPVTSFGVAPLAARAASTEVQRKLAIRERSAS